MTQAAHQAFSPPVQVPEPARLPHAVPAGDPGPPQVEPSRLEVSLPWQRRLVRRLVLIDLAAASAAAVLALFVRFGDDATFAYFVLTLLFPLGFAAMVGLARGYEARFLGSGSEEFRRVTDAGVRYLATAATLAFATQYGLARGYVVVVFPAAIVLALLGRYAARQSLHRARARGEYSHRVLAIGRERSAAELVRTIRKEAHAGLHVVGACIDGSDATEVEGVPVLGTASSGVLEALAVSGADTVVVGAWSPLSQLDLRRLSWQLEGTGVSMLVAPSVADVAGPRLHIRPVAGLPLLHVEQPEFSGVRRVVKSLFDRSLAGLALLLLSPLLLSVAVAVRATSEGPALFRQVRVGKDGSTFRMYKFRSMRVTAEEELAALIQQNEAADGLLFKMREDPRVTPVGRWMRRFSVDELPQLINVVRGQMSLVGPRPPLPNEVERYLSDVQRRLLVAPGLTGLWQVSGRSDLSWEESVALDLYYVENWTLALDLTILWKTFFAVVRRDGAY